MIKLSIITCTYNSESFLEKCISSVENQNLPQYTYEHIFIDAYSSDKTNLLIKDYQDRNPNISIHLMQRAPKWVYNALNEWIKIANWEYIFFLNSDDFLEWDVLKNYLSYIEETGNNDLYYWKINIVNTDGIIQKTIPNKYLLLRKFLFKFSFNVLVYYPSVILKRSTLLELGMFDESKKIASDFGLWLNYLKHKKSFVYSPFCVTNFLEHELSLSSNPKNYALQLSEVRFFRKKYLWLLWLIVDNILFIGWKIRFFRYFD